MEPKSYSGDCNPNRNLHPSKPSMAAHFLKCLSRIQQTANDSSVASRSRRIRLAAYASMAYSAGHRRAWSRALLRKLRCRRARSVILPRRPRIARPQVVIEIDRAEVLRKLVPGGTGMDYDGQSASLAGWGDERKEEEEGGSVLHLGLVVVVMVGPPTMPGMVVSCSQRLGQHNHKKGIDLFLGFPACFWSSPHPPSYSITFSQWDFTCWFRVCCCQSNPQTLILHLVVSLKLICYTVTLLSKEARGLVSNIPEWPLLASEQKNMFYMFKISSRIAD
ncbi:hypothetical protein C4D60_Mb08t01000 [Musa balbisiana]|uniref:IBH1-like N-terminal domain-containing protein n=1 Tax=Musa balbisiana TaxID=52838 RepID=A0A4S8K0K0_MUSBA|nr:hypothetical protein C4D60_Mb08t01000 [Musa balbisiana]